MNRFILSAITLLCSCLPGCSQQGFKTLDADDFEKAISSDSVQLVDVRTTEEFTEAHISSQGIKNIDIRQDGFIEKAEQELDKGKTVAVYCRSGKRSENAAKLLCGHGFKVINLKGGILEWQKRGKAMRK